ncbi:MAG: double-stranded DNA-binding protein [Candidatus Methanomethylicia archaeon]
MSVEDIDLEVLKLKKIAKMRKSITRSDEAPVSMKDYKSILLNKLTERAKEILKYAEEQFPEETKRIIEVLAKAIDSGVISDYIDEYSLYDLFISLGLNVRIPTKIYYARKGEKKSLYDLFKGV